MPCRAPVELANSLHSDTETTSPRVVGTLKFLRVLGCLSVARNLHSGREITSPRVVGTLEFQSRLAFINYLESRAGRPP